jgi:hypothetical protein
MRGLHSTHTNTTQEGERGKSCLSMYLMPVANISAVTPTAHASAASASGPRAHRANPSLSYSLSSPRFSAGHAQLQTHQRQGNHVHGESSGTSCMQAFITTVFSHKTVRICLIINEIYLEIRLKQPSATSLEHITWLNNQQEGIVCVKQEILPVHKSDLTQLCEWIKDTEEQDFSLEDITGFLNF